MAEEFRPPDLEKQLAVCWNNRKMRRLSEMSMQAVIKNVDISTASQRPMHCVQYLPTVLLSDLEHMLAYKVTYADLNSADGTAKKWRRFVVSLMHHRLTKIHLPGNLRWNEQIIVEFVKLLENVGVKCSGLQLFEAKANDLDDPPDLKKNDFRPRNSFFGALPQLVHLQVVRLHFFLCDDWALQQFGQHGTNIVILQVTLAAKVSSVGFEALSKLKHLQQFLFGDFEEDWQLHRVCLLLCTQFLPKLRFIGLDFSDLNNETFEEEDHGNFYHDQVVQQPIQLGLEEVILSGHAQPHNNCQLPQLRTLHLFRPVGDVAGMCDRFLTLSEISFYEGDTDTVMAVLQLVGRRLHKLVMEEIGPQEFVLPTLLQLCPNLKHLHIVMCGYDDSYTSAWPTEIFGCLEEVNLQMVYEPLPCGFIVMLLGAPLLKKVHMYDIYLTKAEVDQLLGLVRQRSILHNIVSIEWNNYLQDEEIKPWMAAEEHFRLLLDTIKVTSLKLISLMF